MFGEWRWRLRRIRQRFPQEWDRGERLFHHQYSKRNRNQRPAVRAVLESAGFATYDPYEFPMGLVTDAFIDPNDPGEGLDLDSLSEDEIKLYFIALDGFSKPDLFGMMQSLVGEVWSEAKDRRTLSGDCSDYVRSLGYIHSYIHRR